MALPRGREGDVVFPVTETMDLYCMSLLIRLARRLKGQGHWLSFPIRKDRWDLHSQICLIEMPATAGLVYNRKIKKIVSNTKKKELIVCFLALLSI